MKALSVASLLMAGLAFVLVACSDSSAPVAGPTDQALSSSTTSTDLAKCGVRVISSLRGSANNYYDLWYLPDGTLMGTVPDPKGKFYTIETFEADAYSNGKASGSFHYQFLGKLPPGVSGGFFGKFDGKVLRLVVEGNKAFVVVEIENWKSWALPAWFAQVFIDNGKRGWSRDKVSEWFTTNNPDVASDPLGYGSRDLWLTMGPDQFIQWTTAQLKDFPSVPPVFPIDHGNIQVR
jgi:hypothetical protein